MQTNKIKSFIYLGDIHGNPYLEKLIQDKHNGNENFVFCGDLFDIGKKSYQIYYILRDLFNRGVGTTVLGNHDFFFIFSHLYGLSNQKINSLLGTKISEDENTNLQKLFKIYKDQYFRNGGDTTEESLLKAFNEDPEDNGIDEEDFLEFKLEIVKFLFTNFDIFHIDSLNNITIHGGVPILPNGDIVAEEIEGQFYIGIDRIKKINEKIKMLDYDVIKNMSAYFENYKDDVFIKMKKHGYSNGKHFHNTDVRDYIPTWFPNYYYDKYDEVKASLEQELNRHGLKKLIVGHYYNEYNKFNETPKDQRFYRLDRGIVKSGNFGVLIIDKDGNVMEIEDVANLVDLG